MADVNLVRIPHIDDDLIDLPDEQLVALLKGSLPDKVHPKYDPEAFAIGTACERELRRRGKDDLVVLIFKEVEAIQ